MSLNNIDRPKQQTAHENTVKAGCGGYVTIRVFVFFFLLKKCCLIYQTYIRHMKQIPLISSMCGCLFTHLRSVRLNSDQPVILLVVIQTGGVLTGKLHSALW